MIILISKINKKLKQYLNNPLYKNSILLVISRFFNVAAGFFFWIVAAKFYSIENVGLATALISSLELVILFSRFGLDFSIIRFLPTGNKTKIFNTCLTTSTISSFIVGIIYISFINYLSPNLSFIQGSSYAIIFLVFVLLNSITTITGNAFLANRNADRFFSQYFLLALRVPLLIPLVFFGSFGIFTSVGLANLFAALFAFYSFSKVISIDFKLDKQFIGESFQFSYKNYISNVLLEVPTLIMPILILNLMSEADVAKYYIAFAIGSLILIIPNSLSTAVFVEGSYGKNMRENVTKAGLTIYCFLIPTVILIYFFGDFFLNMIGKGYFEAFELLRYLALSSLFVGVYSLFVPIENVRMNVESVVKLNVIRFLLLMGFSYFFILKYGIVGVGYAWLITYGILAVIILILVNRNGWI